MVVTVLDVEPEPDDGPLCPGPPPPSGEIGSFFDVPIVESPAMSWRDPPMLLTADAFGRPALVVGDKRFFCERMLAALHVRQGFDALYRRFGLTRGGR